MIAAAAVVAGVLAIGVGRLLWTSAPDPLGKSYPLMTEADEKLSSRITASAFYLLGAVFLLGAVLAA